jgi:hypothetical protein
VPRRDRDPDDRRALQDGLLLLRTAYVAGRIEGADPFAPPGLAELTERGPDGNHHPLPELPAARAG